MTIKTKPTDSKLLKRLKTQERSMAKLLDDYSDILNRVSEIIYKLKMDVVWGKILRFSTTSNFVMISGRVLIKQGEELGGKPLTEDFILTPSLIFPLEMLDDGSTPYQLVDACKAIVQASHILGPDNFSISIVDENTTMETYLSIIPSSDLPTEENDVVDEPKQITINDDLSEKLSGFDFKALSDKQLESYNLTFLSKITK